MVTVHQRAVNTSRVGRTSGMWGLVEGETDQLGANLTMRWIRSDSYSEQTQWVKDSRMRMCVCVGVSNRSKVRKVST